MTKKCPNVRSALFAVCTWRINRTSGFFIDSSFGILVSSFSATHMIVHCPPLIRRAILALLITLSVSSCSVQPYGGESFGQTAFRYGQQQLQKAKLATGRVVSLLRRDNSFWYADQMRGKPSIEIRLGEQMVYLYKGGQLAGGSPISSGKEGYDTRPGRYQITEKDIDHKSSIYGDYEDMYGNVIMKDIDNRTDRRPPGTRFEGAKMYYFMRIYGGVGMHQGYLPGYAASHGCIRLPGHMAEKFYRVTPMGTPVRIVP
jgi:L,D-transpeptidase catalytic domain